MQSTGTTEYGCQRVGYGQVVVVVGVEVEVGVGIALHHLTEILYHLQGVHDTKSVGQHEATDTRVDESIHHLVNIIRGVLHAVRPVFQVEVHADTQLTGVCHRLADVGDMLAGHLAQLLAAMLQRAFGQQVQGLAATVGNPVYTLMPVDEAENLYFLEAVNLTGITADHLDGLFLAVADTSRPHFDAIDVKVVQ